jgi:hypothetical protein
MCVYLPTVHVFIHSSSHPFTHLTAQAPPMAAVKDYPSPSTLTSGLTLPSTCHPPGEDNPPTQKTWIVSPILLHAIHPLCVHGNRLMQRCRFLVLLATWDAQ